MKKSVLGTPEAGRVIDEFNALIHTDNSIAGLTRAYEDELKTIRDHIEASLVLPTVANQKFLSRFKRRKTILTPDSEWGNEFEGLPIAPVITNRYGHRRYELFLYKVSMDKRELQGASIIQVGFLDSELAVPIRSFTEEHVGALALFASTVGTLDGEIK